MVEVPKTILELAEHVHKAKPRKFVTVADILGCVQKESHFASVFRESDQQFRDNRAAAARICKMEPSRIVEAARITVGPLKGQISKFRSEPGYFTWSSKLKHPFLTEEDRFLLSCSFGLGQKMARWLVSLVKPEEWDKLVARFMGDEEMQLLYCAGDLDSLMIGAGGNKAVAFTRYNEGTRPDPYTGKPQLRVTDYGRTVASYSAAIAKLLDD